MNLNFGDGVIYNFLQDIGQPGENSADDLALLLVIMLICIKPGLSLSVPTRCKRLPPDSLNVSTVVVISTSSTDVDLV